MHTELPAHLAQSKKLAVVLKAERDALRERSAAEIRAIQERIAKVQDEIEEKRRKVLKRKRKEAEES